MDTKALIRALGGPTVVSDLCGVGPSAVCNWPSRGIPAEHHLTLWRAAVAASVEWTPPGYERASLTIPAVAAE